MKYISTNKTIENPYFNWQIAQSFSLSLPTMKASENRSHEICTFLLRVHRANAMSRRAATWLTFISKMKRSTPFLILLLSFSLFLSYTHTFSLSHPIAFLVIFGRCRSRQNLIRSVAFASAVKTRTEHVIKSLTQYLWCFSKNDLNFTVQNNRQQHQFH